jgi:hypothetical protein
MFIYNAHSLQKYMYVTLPYKHLRITEPEVYTGASLSTGMSRTTERIAPVKYWNNPEK